MSIKLSDIYSEFFSTNFIIIARGQFSLKLITNKEFGSHSS